MPAPKKNIEPKKRTYTKKAAQPQVIMVQAPSKAKPKTMSKRTYEKKSYLSSKFHNRGAVSVIKQLAKFDAFNVRQNSLMPYGGSLKMPAEFKNSNSGHVIRHREYVSEVYGSIDFTVGSIPINPGLPGSFPWCAPIANSHECYRIRGMAYEFVSTCSDSVLSSAASGALGSVVIATQYNSAAPPFSSKIQMDNHEYATSAKPSVNQIHPIECMKTRDVLSELYVRGGAQAADTDIRMYDLGRLQIATEGMQADDGAIGELWCTYEIEFFVPRYNPDAQILTSQLTDHYSFADNFPTNSKPLGITGEVRNPNAGSTLGSYIQQNGNFLTFPADANVGEYLVVYTCIGTSTASLNLNTTVSNCNFLSKWNQNTLTKMQAPNNNAGNTSTTMTWVAVVTLGAAGAYINFDTSTLPASVTSCDIYVTQVNNGVTGAKKKAKQIIQKHEEAQKDRIKVIDSYRPEYTN